MERPGLHLNIGVHCDPGHVGQDPNPHVSYLKVDSLLPVECKLPALYHSIVPNVMTQQVVFPVLAIVVQSNRNGCRKLMR
ncbi:unnamed protein product [Linum trigynum]|uniref:Uncharacterized protein n=1 Tax=Linum trigynum TaxID=586398 RepID=A0AAV2EL75_9ROSI